MNKRSVSDVIILATIIPVLIQAGIIVGITFYGFGLAALHIVGII
jgi:hypothetical protein